MSTTWIAIAHAARRLLARLRWLLSLLSPRSLMPAWHVLLRCHVLGCRVVDAGDADGVLRFPACCRCGRWSRYPR